MFRWHKFLCEFTICLKIISSYEYSEKPDFVAPYLESRKSYDLSAMLGIPAKVLIKIVQSQKVLLMCSAARLCCAGSKAAHHNDKSHEASMGD